jgi:hypothetical protein
MDEHLVKSCRDGGIGSTPFFDAFARVMVRAFSTYFVRYSSGASRKRIPQKQESSTTPHTTSSVISLSVC